MPYADPEKARENKRLRNQNYVRTGGRKAWRDRRRAEWIASVGGKCLHCGATESLEADHIDPSTKDPKLRGRSVSSLWQWAEARRVAELAKCQPLCKPCHEAKTARESRPDLSREIIRP